MFFARRLPLQAFLYTLSVSSMALAQPAPAPPSVQGTPNPYQATQPTPPDTRPVAPAKPQIDSPIPGGFGTAPGVATIGTTPGTPIDSERFRQALAKALQGNSGGLTAEAVASRARTYSPDVAAKREAVRAAAARVDQALVGFFPRLNGVARYTRLSEATSPSVSIPLVSSNVGVGQPIANLDQLKVIPFGFSFAQILNQYTLQAQLTVPISDYVFRISQNHDAATYNAEAAKYDRIAAEAKASADAKIAFYTWVKAVGQRLAVEQALIGAKEHFKDAQAEEKAGQLSKADLLGIESQVAAGDLTLAQADQFVQATEDQLRTMIGADPAEKFSIGEDFTADLPKATIDTEAAKQEGLANRAELKSLGANEQSLDKTATVAVASAWPRLDLSGNATYANPNTRFVPQTATWRPTWDVTLQLSWSPNDTFTARAASAEVSANAAKIHAQKQQARDGVTMEVTSAALDVRTSDIALDSAVMQLTATEEALRVRREQGKVGKSTGALLTDAETNLLRARLTAVNARLDQRIARVKLEHAAGRDTLKR